MTDRIVRVSFKRDFTMFSLHPHIERIMQKKISQDGAYYGYNNVAKLGIEFSKSIPRDRLRPGYGDGFQGAPLRTLAPAVTDQRDRGGRLDDGPSAKHTKGKRGV
jgi:hypothetical protein